MGAVESGERRSLGGDYPRELAGVAEALDQLLDHVERRHQRDQEALSDLAHSIKTPLTLLQGIEPNDPNTRSLIDEQVLRLDAVVRHYLDHASLTPGRPLAPPLALTPLIERVVAALGRIDRRGISVDLQVDMEWQVAGSEGEWFELFGNLLENGFKWANHQVRVVIDAVEDGVVIVVSDDGPGVEEEELAGLAERGCRLDESVPGHGIGLSTVATIVAARQGRIDFGRSVEGGLQVSIWLPATVVRVWGKGQGKDKNLSDLL